MAEGLPRFTRRSLADYLLATGVAALAAGVLYPLAKYLNPPRVKEVAAGSVVASKVGELKPNVGKVFLFGSKPAILVHTPGGTYKAFTAVCTHLACTVQYRPDFGHIWCACHDGHYDLNGQVLAGPPPSPLAEFGVAVKGSDIVVSRPA
ncbi:MAG TPA: Rieske 2Fe-2S domain-containing protein [bacterium]|nr:Rieske 2Fe-2S domain-containing protein [bacterium]